MGHRPQRCPPARLRSCSSHTAIRLLARRTCFLIVAGVTPITPAASAALSPRRSTSSNARGDAVRAGAGLRRGVRAAAGPPALRGAAGIGSWPARVPARASSRSSPATRTWGDGAGPGRLPAPHGLLRRPVRPGRPPSGASPSPPRATSRSRRGSLVPGDLRIADATSTPKPSWVETDQTVAIDRTHRLSRPRPGPGPSRRAVGPAAEPGRGVTPHPAARVSTPTGSRYP